MWVGLRAFRGFQGEFLDERRAGSEPLRLRPLCLLIRLLFFFFSLTASSCSSLPCSSVHLFLCFAPYSFPPVETVELPLRPRYQEIELE